MIRAIDDGISVTVIRAVVAALLVVGTFGASRPVHAQSADAQTLFDDGEVLMTRGEFAKACDAFAAANRIAPGAGVLIRLGDCREHTYQLASAWSAYKEAAGRAKDPRKRELANGKVEELAPLLSLLRVDVKLPAQGLVITRDNVPLDRSLWGRAVAIDGGEIVVTATAPGHKPWRTTVQVPIDHGHVELDVPELVPNTVATRPVHRSVRRPLRVGSIVLGTLGIAGLGVGTWLGWSANSRQNQAYSLCSDSTKPCADAARATALVMQGHTRALGADASFAIGAVAILTAGALWWFGTERVPIVDVAGDRATFSIAGRF